MNYILIVVVVILTISEATSKKLDSRQNKKTTNVINLRGTLRQRFGLIASLKKNNSNNVCSPIVALLPLGSLAVAAQGSTLKEINKVIGVADDEFFDVHDDGREWLKDHLFGLYKDIEHLPGVTLDIANRFYVSDTKKLYTKFVDMAEDVFDMSLEKINFNDSSTAVKKINNWVSQKTHGMISDLLSPNSISPKPSLVVVNAIYFVGKWKEAFRNMDVGLFYSPGRPRVVRTMVNIALYKYGVSSELRSELVELPYMGDKCTFLIVFPAEKNGLKRLLKQLERKPELLDQAIQEMFPQVTRLTMPTFKIESEWNLTALYKEVGLSSIFDRNRSGLTEIVEDEQLYISEAIQKAVIEVNEIGSNPGAVPDLGELNNYMQIPHELNINHPFLFYVIANSQQLLTGTYN